MGIQTTRQIHRSDAINRIKEIAALAFEFKYKDIEEATGEDYNFNFENFVNEEQKEKARLEHIDNWTNQMIEDKIDEPCYRHSIFDNYTVIDDDQEIEY